MRELWRIIAVGFVSLFFQICAGQCQSVSSATPSGSSVKCWVQYSGGVEGQFDVTYASIDGYRPLKLDLYYARENKTPKPAILWLHGGGWALGNPRGGSSLWGEWDQVLARLSARGYVTVGVSYRLSGEARFPAAIQDIKAAIRWLRANSAAYGIDPKRIAVWGSSAGGHLAALTGTSCGVRELEGQGGNADQPSCVQAVVDWYGPTDFSLLDSQAAANSRIRHNDPGSPESRFLGCELMKCAPTLVQSANPIAYVSAEDPPFLIMHGDADTAVPLKQSQILYDALRTKGVSVDLEVTPGVNHGFDGASSSQAKSILSKVFAFFDKTLGVHPAAE
jgi:acetyl esterase/lipase